MNLKINSIVPKAERNAKIGSVLIALRGVNLNKMKKRILKFLERYSNIEIVGVDYNRPQFDLCHYEINFKCSDIDFCVDVFFDTYESEESKQRTFDNLDSEIESRLKLHGLKLERKTK